MYNTEKHEGKSWRDMDSKERLVFLTRENAYLIWERRIRTGRAGTPEQDWAEAAALVGATWKAWIL
ncbi:MAG: hypothetical protein P4L67_00135 [Candidatus Pacebacteria bacterium]|nr:hypothetical protein [Candidatus Paceibacterota bacterium]